MHLTHFRVFCALIIFPILASPITQAQPVGTKIWNFQTDGKVTSDPAMGPDGTIYVGSEDHKLYALSPNGTRKWEFATAAAITVCPVVGANGAIFIGSTDGTLYGVNSAGNQLWRFPTGDAITEPPALAVDGTIYLVSEDGNMYAINPNGSEKWRFRTDTVEFPNAGSVPAPSVGFDGTIYVGSMKFLGSNNPRLNALKPDGTVKWTYSPPFNDYVALSPVLESDGTIYFSDSSPELYAIGPDGKQKWISSLSEVSIGQAGRLFGIRELATTALRANGEVIWREFSLVGLPTTTPAIASDGTVYMGTDEGWLYALNSDGAVVWGYDTDSRIHSSPVITTNGIVCFGADDGNLYAVKGTSGPALSAWSMYRGNAQRTGALWNTVIPETGLGLRMYPGVLINGSLGNAYRVEHSDNADGLFFPLFNGPRVSWVSFIGLV